MSKGPRVDTIVLQPRESDRLASGGVRQIRFEIHLLEQLHHLAPSIGGFKDNWASGLQAAEQRSKLLPVVHHVAVEQLVSVFVGHGHLGATTVYIQPDIKQIDLPLSMESPR